MRIKLNKIKLENFKGLKVFEADFDGNNAKIRAENGVGKTTIYDAFLWLLFGKDSVGRTDFGMRPMDSDNKPIKGLVLAVEAALEVNGTSHTLRKEQHEHIIRDQIKGYTAVCKIDEVPKKVGEFQDWVTETIPEEIFKMLTDLAYFNGKMKWSDRRKVLLDIAGQVSTPAGFDKLIATLAGREIEDYENVLKSQKKAHIKERDEINPRMDEIQRGLKDYVQSDSTLELEAKRDIKKEEIADLDKERKDLLGKETERQGHIEHENRLTVKRLHRESVLKNQTGPVDDLLDERAELERKHADRTQELVNLQSQITQWKGVIDSSQNQIDESLLTLKSIKDEYKNADSPNCSMCGQLWPEDKPKPGLSDIEARGNNLKQKIDEQKQEVNKWGDEWNKLLVKEEGLVAELKAAEEAKNKRIAEINEAIENRPEPDPTQDSEWQELTKQIVKTKEEIGEPVTEQLEAIEAKKKTAEDELQNLNETLAQADNIKKDEARIVELEAKGKDLAQKIVTIDGQLEEIDRFNAEQNKLIEATVNGLFKHIEYKLFDYYLNEGYKPCCVAILDGVPYPDMSTGEEIFSGIDAINTLSDHYGVEVPLFIDRSESMTMPIEAESQVIELRAVKGVKELLIEVEQKEKVEAA